MLIIYNKYDNYLLCLYILTLKLINSFKVEVQVELSIS